MTDDTIAHPRIVSAEDWSAERKAFLVKEKALTRQIDAVNAERRRLPMVRIEKEYAFEGPAGKVGFRSLFADRRQLIVYHFMFDPEWDKGCPGCTGYVNALGDLSMLEERDTTFVLISRALLSKLEAYRALQGWKTPWYSSFGSDFNRDFGVTLDTGETQGLSVFFRIGDDVFHTYSTYARGVERPTDSYGLLDTTP